MGRSTRNVFVSLTSEPSKGASTKSDAFSSDGTVPKALSIKPVSTMGLTSTWMGESGKTAASGRSPKLCT